MSGPNSMSKPFVDSVGVLAWWFSIIYARESSLRTSTIPLSIPCFGMCLHTTASWPCLAGSKIPIEKGKWNQASDTHRKLHSKDCASRAWKKRKLYLDRWEERWADTRIHGTTKRQVAVMFAEEKPSLLPLPLEPFRYYQYGERVVHLDGCVEVEAAYYGLPPGWIGRSVKVQWDALHVRILHPPRINFFVSISARNAAGIASRTKTTQRKCRSVPLSCCSEPAELEPRSAYSVTPSIGVKGNRAFAASWGSSP